MNKKRLIPLLCLILVLGAGLGLLLFRRSPTVPRPAPEPAPEAAPTPEPTPTPTPEPDWPAGPAVTVDGHALASGSVLMHEVPCVALEEYAAAAGFGDVAESGGSRAFTWRGRSVSLSARDAAVAYGEKETALDEPVALWHGRLWVPAESFSLALEIGFFDDAEEQHLYCTPGAGGWELPEGYAVPCLMYHGVGNDAWSAAELFVSPEAMEEQIQFLLDNGWDPIWFSDLEHVQDYDKPILLTYDDGLSDNYTDLFPLVKKYNIKITCFVCPRFIEDNDRNYMKADAIREMAESGLVDFQSHSYSHHPEIYNLSDKDLLHQLADSQLYLLRLTGKESFVFCYPCGSESRHVREVMLDYYRFGVKMGGPCYVTGADPTLIYRIYVKRGFYGPGLGRLLDAALSKLEN